MSLIRSWSQDRGLRHGWTQLRPFLPPRSGLRIGTVGVLSFLGGIAESAVLVLLTLTADSLIRGASAVDIGGWSLDRRDATLLALVLVASRVVALVGASAVSARFAATVVEKTEGAAVAAYLRSSYVARSARPSGDLNTVVVNHGRFTGDLALGFTLIAASVCGLLAFGGTSLAVNPIATIGIAAIGVVVLALLKPLRSRSHAAARSFTRLSRTLGNEMTEIEQLQREIELFRVGHHVQDRVGRQIGRGAEQYQRIRFLGSTIPQLFQAAMLAAAVISLLLDRADRGRCRTGIRGCGGPVAHPFHVLGTAIRQCQPAPDRTDLIRGGDQRTDRHAGADEVPFGHRDRSM